MIGAVCDEEYRPAELLLQGREQRQARGARQAERFACLSLERRAGNALEIRKSAEPIEDGLDSSQAVHAVWAIRFPGCH
jgi:hypothetical protein